MYYTASRVTPQSIFLSDANDCVQLPQVPAQQRPDHASGRGFSTFDVPDKAVRGLRDSLVDGV